jgi:hypothetical protein
MTIGVPVYNGMPYLKETMESLFRQTFADFKILVINDGSKDGSLEYLRSLKDPRLKIVSQDNRGLTSTLNRMLREIDTPWLVRQDADDISLPDRMAVLNEWVMSYPDAGLVYSRASHYQDDRLLVDLQASSGTPEELRNLTRAGHLLSICHSAVAINARKLLDIGGYRFDLYVEDYDMYWRMALATDLRYIPKVLVGARTGSRGLSGTNIGRQQLSMLWVQYLLMSEILRMEPLDYPEAIKSLEPLMTPGMIEYRLHMRQCLDSIGERKTIDASIHLLHAAIASPRLFGQRISNFFRRRGSFVLGIDPAVFKWKKKDLWPNAAPVLFTTGSPAVEDASVRTATSQLESA